MKFVALLAMTFAFCVGLEAKQGPDALPGVLGPASLAGHEVEDSEKSNSPKEVMMYKHSARSKPRKKCRDRKSPMFCQKALKKSKCHKKKVMKRCKKTCGLCTKTECKDIGFNCFLASPFTCSIFQFATGCKKSCNLCPTETTKAPIVTATSTKAPEEDCIDISSRCEPANKYRCAIFWFQRGCMKTCGVCTPRTTTAPSTTTTTTTTKETTTPERTTVPEEETTTEEPTTISMRRTTEATEPTAAPMPQTTSNGSKIIPTGSGEEGTEAVTQPSLCVDTNPKNCHTWETLGLCYNPEFSDEMKKACPLSCGVCVA